MKRTKETGSKRMRQLGYEAIVLWIKTPMLKRLRELAELSGLPLSSMIRQWCADRVVKEVIGTIKKPARAS